MKYENVNLSHSKDVRCHETRSVEFRKDLHYKQFSTKRVNTDIGNLPAFTRACSMYEKRDLTLKEQVQMWKY